MKRLSSATGCNERDLNSTRVFRSQDGAPATSMVFAVALVVCAGRGCHRATSAKPAEATTANGDRENDSLPRRTAPPLPQALPGAEELPTTAPLHRGGVLRVHLENEPAHLNPLADADAAALQVVSGLVYETLVECPTAGAAADYRPGLADSWQMSPDGTRLSLHLRPGVRWHDGPAFGVLDVQASVEPLLLNGRGGSQMLRASLQDVAAIEIAADRVVRLVFRRPSNMALGALCGIPILPDHLLRGAGADAGALARAPIGTGPFRFAGWDRGKRIKLARAATIRADGPAALDEIAFEIDTDGARALMRTRRGEIDVLPRVLPAHYPDEVDPVTLHGALVLRRLRPDRWAYVAVNQQRTPLSDARYRRALSALWDREHFARDLHRGLAHPIGAPPFAHIAAAPAGRERAAAALDDAGYLDTNSDGVRDLDGKVIRHSLLIAAGARTAATEAHAFVFEARKVGILLDLAVIDGAALIARVRKGDFDLALMQWEGDPDEDPGVLFASTGPFNFGGYRSVEVDRVLDLVRLADGPVRRQPLLDSLGRMLADEQPVLFLYQFDVVSLVARRVHDLAAVGGRLDLRRVWIDP